MLSVLFPVVQRIRHVDIPPQQIAQPFQYPALARFPADEPQHRRRHFGGRLAQLVQSGVGALLQLPLALHLPGEYRIDGQLIRDLSETKAAEYRNRLIGFIFQSFNLISFKTAVENVELPLFYQGVSRKKRRTLAMEYLERLDLAPWAEHYPNEMSGGQKQRVAIARALITQPRLILADEPTGALDSKTSVEVMELLKQLNQEQHKTIIVVTHESGVANETNKIIHIKDGIIGKIEENKDHKASPFGINGIMK